MSTTRTPGTTKKKAGTGSRSKPAHGVEPREAEARREAIAIAAYFRAEKRGFAPGAEWQDWFEAERELPPRA